MQELDPVKVTQFKELYRNNERCSILLSKLAYDFYITNENALYELCKELKVSRRSVYYYIQVGKILKYTSHCNEMPKGFTAIRELYPILPNFDDFMVYLHQRGELLSDLSSGEIRRYVKAYNSDDKDIIVSIDKTEESIEDIVDTIVEDNIHINSKSDKINVCIKEISDFLNELEVVDKLKEDLDKSKEAVKKLKFYMKKEETK